MCLLLPADLRQWRAPKLAPIGPKGLAILLQGGAELQILDCSGYYGNLSQVSTNYLAMAEI